MATSPRSRRWPGARPTLRAAGDMSATMRRSAVQTHRRRCSATRGIARGIIRSSIFADSPGSFRPTLRPTAGNSMRRAACRGRSPRRCAGRMGGGSYTNSPTSPPTRGAAIARRFSPNSKPGCGPSGRGFRATPRWRRPSATCSSACAASPASPRTAASAWQQRRRSRAASRRTRSLDADPAGGAFAPRLGGEGHRLHVQVLARLRPLPRGRPHPLEQQRRRSGPLSRWTVPAVLRLRPRRRRARGTPFNGSRFFFEKNTYQQLIVNKINTILD